MIRFSLILFVLLSGCIKDDSIDSCGCNSETVKEIINQNGVVSIKRQLIEEDEFYIDKYWISLKYGDCDYCWHNYIVCNDDILEELKNEIESLPITSHIDIKFSGDIKETCIKTHGPPEITYQRIILTKIDKL